MTTAAMDLLFDAQDRRMETDAAFVSAVLQVPCEWLPRLVRITRSDLALTLHVGDVLISRHAIRASFDPDAYLPGYVFSVESTWFGGVPGTDIQRAIERVDREEAQELDEHCASLTPADSALYGRIRR